MWPLDILRLANATFSIRVYMSNVNPHYLRRSNKGSKPVTTGTLDELVTYRHYQVLVGVIYLERKRIQIHAYIQLILIV